MAHASPVYLEVDGSRCSSPKDAALFVRWVDEALKWVQSKANIPDAGQKAEMIELFQKAKQVYLGRSPEATEREPLSPREPRPVEVMAMP